ncbi:MAG: SpoIVB peptidase [Eubacterium sp.]|nr:SpoIVB peptidase [Eubacterium sp.]
MKQQKKNKAMRWYRRLGIMTWLIFSYVSLFAYIPDEIYVSRGSDETKFAKGLPIVVDEVENTQPVFGTQRVGAAADSDGVLLCRLFDLIPVKQVVVHDADRQMVTAAGTNIGIYLKNSGVLVVECGSFTDQSGALISPAAYRIRSGDIIRSVDGEAVASKEDLIRAVEDSGGRQLVLQIARGSDTIDVAVTPEVASDGTNKLGLWVRDDIAGIGTLTFVTEDRDYGALGHGVSDIDTGELIQIDTGSIYETKITGISKGKRGTPGEVTGLIQFRSSAYLGTIGENGENGIYGKLEQLPDALECVEELPVGYKQEITQGSAQIICSVEGERKAYEIEIESVDYHPREVNKGIRYRVVDEQLLEATGGIIQGMSGSPIIQNGRLVGAVTHVFVDDPTRGYGIFAECMLEEL